MHISFGRIIKENMDFLVHVYVYVKLFRVCSKNIVLEQLGCQIQIILLEG